MHNKQFLQNFYNLTMNEQQEHIFYKSSLNYLICDIYYSYCNRDNEQTTLTELINWFIETYQLPYSLETVKQAYKVYYHILPN